MSALRLDIIVRREPVDWDTGGEDIRGDRWTWRLWSGSRIVSSSGSQRYSRRIDCARGAEVGTGFHDVQNIVAARLDPGVPAWRWTHTTDLEYANVRLIDERTP